MAEHQINQKLALEMTMQDVLGNLEELALDFGYRDGEDCFEILAIEPCVIPDSIARRDEGSDIRPPFTAQFIPLFHRVA